MSTLRVNTIQDTAGSGSPAINGLARAWVNFNGTGTVAIRAASNVSSITDNGTGLYTLNFTTALTDSNYSATFNADDNSGNNPHFITFRSGTTSTLAIGTWQSAVGRVDIANISVAIFR